VPEVADSMDVGVKCVTVTLPTCRLGDCALVSFNIEAELKLDIKGKLLIVFKSSCAVP
jgi:hypothetical protein